MQGPGTFANLTVQELIAIGPNGGVFVYDAATGKLIGAISNAAVDPVNGTTILPVIAAYSTQDNSYVQLLPGTAGSGQASLNIGSGNSAESTPAKVLTQVFGAGPTRRIITTARAPRVTGEALGAACSLLLESPSADLTIGVLASITVSDDGVNFGTLNISQAQSALANVNLVVLQVGTAQLSLLPGSLTLSTVPFISTAGTSSTPSLFTTDTWHTMTPLQNSWAAAGAPNAPPQYRLTTDNEVEIVGTLNGVAATAAQFFNLPAPYRPALRQAGFASGATGNVLAGRAPFIQLDTAGNLTVTGTAALPAAGVFVFSGKCPLDLV